METVTIPERTRRFSKLLLRVLLRPVRQTAATRIFVNQLLRSGTSVGANVLEAQYAASRKQFFQYYRIALRSARESEYWLDLLAMTDSFSASELSELTEEIQQISRILSASLLKDRKMV